MHKFLPEENKELNIYRRICISLDIPVFCYQSFSVCDVCGVKYDCKILTGIVLLIQDYHKHFNCF